MTDLCGISEAGDQLIIDEETGGRPYYEKFERHPTWPGGFSGVTIGNGYDCGYATAAGIAADWGQLLPPTALQALQSVAGVHGSPAAALAHELHWIDVPWDAAMAVFHNKDIPKWVGICEAALPNWGLLPPDCKGALLSTTFNRGASYDLAGGRYLEMRNIKAHMIAREFDKIPAELLAMRRLWPVDGDLWRRRGHEAALFQQGLASLTPT